MTTAEVVQTKKRGKTVALIIITLALIAAIGFFGVRYYIDSTTYVTSENSKIEGNTYPVYAKTAGKVSAVNVKLGDKVKKDDVLVKFDAPPAQPQTGQTTPGAVTTAGNAMTAALTDLTQAKAPVKGTVVNVNTRIDDTVAAGMPLVYLADMAKLQVVSYVLETDINKVKEGQEVEVSVDAYPGVKYTGRVKEIGMGTASQFSLFDLNDATGSFTRVSQRVPVTIDLDDSKDNRMILGLSATVKIKVK